MSLEELCNELGRSRDWRDEVVWHASLGKWTYAGSIFRLTLPRAAGQPRPAAAPARSLDDDGDQAAPNRVRTLLAVVGLSVLGMILALLWRWLA